MLTILADDAKRGIDRQVKNGVFRDRAWYALHARPDIMVPWLWDADNYGWPMYERNVLGYPLDPVLFFTGTENTFYRAWRTMTAAEFSMAFPFTPEWMVSFYTLLKQCGEAVLAGKMDWDHYGLNTLSGLPDKQNRRRWDYTGTPTDYQYNWLDALQITEFLWNDSPSGYQSMADQCQCLALPLFRSGKGKTIEVWVKPVKTGTYFSNFGNTALVEGVWSKLCEIFTTSDTSSSPLLFGPDMTDPRGKSHPALAAGESCGWYADEITIFIRHHDFEEYDS
jgi:hypothetical protein